MDYKPRLLPTVRILLEQRRGEWPEISRQTGIPYRTIQNLAQGVVAGPRVSTVEALYQYLTTVDGSAA